jgi:hypothetical protein
MAYDSLKGSKGRGADKEYLQILQLAATQNETAVDGALNELIDQQQPITFEGVEAIVKSGQQLLPPRKVAVEAVDVRIYDGLLSRWAFHEAGDCYDTQTEGRML